MTASAESGDNIEIISAGIQPTVEFTGAENNVFFFNVNIINPTGESIIIEVQNDDAQILFSKKCSEQTFIKKIKLLNDELTALYNFIIKPQNKEPVQTFVVSITTREADDAAIV